RQRLGKIDMAGTYDAANLIGNRLIIDSALQPVIGGFAFARQPDADAHRLRHAVLVPVHADAGQELEIADKNAGDGLAHSTPLTSAVRQTRCWPPSTAII